MSVGDEHSHGSKLNPPSPPRRSGWHHTPQHQNYQSVLEGVHDYAVKEGIPYKHILLDSWWYTKVGCGAGVAASVC